MSSKSVLILAAFVVSLLIVGGSYAQQPNPLDIVPEKMPFDIYLRAHHLA